MQDKQTDWHIGMITALVFVAASAIFQTVSGLQADNLNAMRSQQMFATVVAASGKTGNPTIGKYVDKMRSVEINNTGFAVIRGSISGVTDNGVTVSTWGGDWKVIVGSGTKIVGQKGILAPTNLKTGDLILIQGLADNSGRPVVSAQTVLDFTLYRAPNPAGTEQGDDSTATGTTATALSPNITPTTPDVGVQMPIAPQRNVAPLGAVQDGVAGVHAVAFPVAGGMKSPLQKSME